MKIGKKNAVWSFFSRDGFEISVRDDYWIVEIKSASLSEKKLKNKIYWSFCPVEHREKTLGIGRLLGEKSSARILLQFHFSISWYYKFIKKMDLKKEFNEMSETNWGAFGKWLEQQDSNKGKKLEISTRRGIFVWLKKAMETAVLYDIYGITYEDIERIQDASRRRFRDYNLLSMKRASERAFNDDEKDQLINILREEWFAWKEWNVSNKQSKPPDLAAVVAIYLCFEETVRPAEINVMTVQDLEFEDKNRIFLHAPNKQEGWIEIDQKSFVMLKALIDYGKEARTVLQTDRLFVDCSTNPKIIGSQELNFRFRKLLKKFSSKYPIKRDDALLSDGRKTLGAKLASDLQDEEMIRVIMRHENTQTTGIYYIRQGKIQLSKNVAKAIKSYAKRLSMAYNDPVYDPTEETTEDVKDIIKRNPKNLLNPYGACSNDSMIEGDCQLGIHCGNCYKLIPMVSKLNAFILEKKIALKKAEEATDEREKENRIAHAAMLEGHILNIEHKVKKVEENG